MNLKRVCGVLVAFIFAMLPIKADDWLMFMNTNDGWTYENETISVSYTFDQNEYLVSGWMVSYRHKPQIHAKIKNNTDEFIYIDLSKTYIARNGEAELYQSLVSMSSDAKSDEGDGNNKLNQSVMPIPPHASKTLIFPIFAEEGDSYDGMIKHSQSKDLYYKPQQTCYLNEIYDYNTDNSPIQTVIAFAYSTTEKAEKQTKVNKEFYVGEMAALPNTKDKSILSVFPSFDSEQAGYFFLDTAYGTVEKKKAQNKDKDKKKEKKENKNNKKERKELKEKMKRGHGLAAALSSMDQ